MVHRTSHLLMQLLLKVGCASSLINHIHLFLFFSVINTTVFGQCIVDLQNFVFYFVQNGKASVSILCFVCLFFYTKQHIYACRFFLRTLAVKWVKLTNILVCSDWLSTESRCGVRCDYKLATEISDTLWKFQYRWQENRELWVDSDVGWQTGRWYDGKCLCFIDSFCFNNGWKPWDPL